MVANHVASSLRGSNPRHNVGYAGDTTSVITTPATFAGRFATRAYQTDIHDT